jgi:hypothetical protein
MYAAIIGNKEIIIELIKYGASIDSEDFKFISDLTDLTDFTDLTDIIDLIDPII